MGTIIGSTIVDWVSKKAIDTAQNMAVNKGKAMLKEYALKKAGEFLFGSELNATGDIDPEKKDFRGLHMYKEVRPGKFVSFFCGGSVISNKDLNDKIKAQIIQQYKRNWAPLADNVAKYDKEIDAEDKTRANVEKTGPADKSVENAGQGDINPNDAKVPVSEVEPITMDDFDALITREEQGQAKAKNKGYLRFEIDKSGNLKLGKVANKCGWFLSWRINITKEHNRQLRNLFADVMLRDFGGVDGVMNADLADCGAVMQKTLSDILCKIKNRKNQGDLLERTTVRDAIDLYKGMFTETNLKDIADSFLSEKLKALKYTKTGRNGVAPSLDEFLKEYGQHAAEGYRSYDDLVEKIKAIASSKTPATQKGKELMTVLKAISAEFAKMKDHWEEDRLCSGYVDQICENPTSTAGLVKADSPEMAQLRGALLRNTGEGGARPNRVSADRINTFLDKVFPTLVDSLRDTYNTECKAKPEDAVRNLKNSLKLSKLKEEIETFSEYLDKNEAKEGKSPLQVIIDDKREELDALQDKMGNIVATGKDPGQEYDSLEKMAFKLTDDINVLEEQKKAFASKEGVKVEGFDRIVDSQDVTEGDKKSLKEIVQKGANALDRDVGLDYLCKRYLKDRCKNIADKIEYGDVRAQLNVAAKAFEGKLTGALAANAENINDLSMQELIQVLGDYLIGESAVDKLKNDVEAHINNAQVVNPEGEAENNIQTTQKSFISAFMEIAIKKALEEKCKENPAKGTYRALCDQFRKQSDKLIEVLGRQIEKVKKNNIEGLKKYSRSLRLYQMKGVLNRTDEHGPNEVEERIRGYIDEATKLICVDLVEPFLKEDVLGLLSETDTTKFEKAAESRLNMRMKTMMAKFQAKENQLVYEGLGLKTVSPDKNVVDNSRLKSSKGDNKAMVLLAFTRRFGDFDVKGVLNGTKDLKKVQYRRSNFKALTDDDFAMEMFRRAEDIWRGTVVHNVPGRSYFYAFDYIKYKLQGLFSQQPKNIPLNDLITKDWVEDKICTKFDQEFSTFFAGCLEFEKKLNETARAAVKAVIKEHKKEISQDERKVEGVVNDIVPSYYQELGAILKRYIAAPEAFKDVDIKGLVNDAMGIRLGADNRALPECDGYKAIMSKLGEARDRRTGEINRNIYDENKNIRQELSAKFQNKLISEIDKSKDKGKLKQVYDCFYKRDSTGQGVQTQQAKYAIEWAIQYAIDFAQRHPFDAYEKDGTTFSEKLVSRALDSLTKVSPVLTKAIDRLSKGVEGLFAKLAESQNDMWMYELLSQKTTDILKGFVSSLCNMAMARTKSGSAFSEKVDKLIDKTLGYLGGGQGSEIEGGLIGELRKLGNGVASEFFLAQVFGFNTAFRQGQAELVECGATEDVLINFIGESKDVWMRLSDKLKDIQTSHVQDAVRALTAEDLEALVSGAGTGNFKTDEKSYPLKKAFAEVSAGVVNELNALSKKCTDRIDELHLNFTAAGMTQLLADNGVRRADFTDKNQFDGVIRSCLDDKVIADAYNSLQTNALGEFFADKRAGGSEFSTSTFKTCLTEGFKLRYDIQTACTEAEKALAEQMKAGVAAPDGENWPKEKVDEFVKAAREDLDRELSDLRNLGKGLRGESDPGVKVETTFGDDNKPVVKISTFKPGGAEVESERTFKVDLQGSVKRSFDAEAWLKKESNVDRIAERVYAMRPVAFTARGEYGKFSKTIVENNRQLVRVNIRAGLVDRAHGGILTKGTPADWEKTLNELIGDNDRIGWDKEKCDRIGLGLYERVEGMNNDVAVEMEKAENSKRNAEEKMKAQCNDILAAVNDAALRWCMPHSLFGKGERGSNYLGKFKAVEPAGNLETFLDGLLKWMGSDAGKKADLESLKPFVGKIRDEIRLQGLRIGQELVKGLIFDDQKGVYTYKKASDDLVKKQKTEAAGVFEKNAKAWESGKMAGTVRNYSEKYINYLEKSKSEKEKKK